jgi:uncharacterized protein
MATAIANDPILLKFRRALGEVYGSRVERIVLFGSRARGDAKPGSDYDVAVFLHGLTDRDCEVDRLAEIEFQIMDETDTIVHALPFPAGGWAERTPFMYEVRREGLDI